MVAILNSLFTAKQLRRRPLMTLTVRYAGKTTQ
jgi:hypothetical protein